MSQSNFRLAHQSAATLAAKIADDLRPVCERVEVAGSVRRRRETVGDIELVVIPKFSRSLFEHIPGQSLLDMHLVALMNQGRLLRGSIAPIQDLTCKTFYLPALARQGHWFKLEINVSTPERWPVELAIKTGSADFSHKLVTYRKEGGFLPGHWRIRDGWQVYEVGSDGSEARLMFESERHFIETICGQWVPPEKRD
jgi:DNA polymerase/3'-5' exonuclease PolX